MGGKYKEKATQAKYMREWHAKNRIRAGEISRAGNKKYRGLHPDANSKSQAAYYTRRRWSIIEFFGGKCCKCGFDDYRALQVDHINGGGHKLRKAGEKIGIKWLIENEESALLKYQLLCANCNWIKKDGEMRTLRKNKEVA